MKRKFLNHPRFVHLFGVLLFIQFVILVANFDRELIFDVQLLLGTIAITLVFLFYTLSRIVHKRRNIGGFHLD